MYEGIYNRYCCCSGLCQPGSFHCLLLWEPTDKASAQGKLSPVLRSPSYFSSFSMSLSFFMLPFVYFFSSLSQWVHACDALQLPAQQREQLDSFIDQLYKDVEKGRVLSLLCSYITVNNFCLHWIELLYHSVFHVWIHVLNCALIRKLGHFSFSLLCVETGDFLNCEGSGLFLLQSSCECRRCSDVTSPAQNPFPLMRLWSL